MIYLIAEIIEVIYIIKKSVAIILIIIVVIVISVFATTSYYLFRDYTKEDLADLFLNKIHNHLEKERLLDVGYYNLVDWSDGVFKITHFLQKNRLEMISDDKNIVLFEDVKGYIKNKDKLYVVSDEGIAVVSKGDVLKICIFDNSSENYTPFTTKNEYGL